MNTVSFPVITEDLAGRIYAVLVETCGARVLDVHERPWCMTYIANNGEDREWRFKGSLGFGGKIYIDANGDCRVDCYPDDKTPERQRMIDAAMVALKELAGAAQGEGRVQS